MPYTLKTQQIAVKDPDTGVYSGVDILAEQTTEGLLTEITATGEAVKADVSAQMATERSDFNTYVSGKEAELDQYKSTTETNINTYVTNKNQEITTMIADADEDVSDLEDRKQDVADAVAGMLSKGVDNTLTTANVPAESKAVGDLFETIVQGKSTQPNDKWNRLWIKPSANDYEIPTMDDHNELKSAFTQTTEELNLLYASDTLPFVGGGVGVKKVDDSTVQMYTITSASTQFFYIFNGLKIYRGNNNTDPIDKKFPAGKYTIRYFVEDKNGQSVNKNVQLCYTEGTTANYVGVGNSSINTATFTAQNNFNMMLRVYNNVDLGTADNPTVVRFALYSGDHTDYPIFDKLSADDKLLRYKFGELVPVVTDTKNAVEDSTEILNELYASDSLPFIGGGTVVKKVNDSTIQMYTNSVASTQYFYVFNGDTALKGNGNTDPIQTKHFTAGKYTVRFFVENKNGEASAKNVQLCYTEGTTADYVSVASYQTNAATFTAQNNFNMMIRVYNNVDLGKEDNPTVIRFALYSGEHLDYPIFRKTSSIDAKARYGIELIAETSLPIPSYYHTNNYIEGKMDAINLYYEESLSLIKFAFVTDTHIDRNAKQTFKLIDYIDRHTNSVPFVIFGGDVVGNITSKDDIIDHAETWIDMMEDYGKRKVFQCRGNHDYLGDVPGGSSIYLDYNIRYNYVMDNQDKAFNGTNMYYYYDVPNKNTRIIVIDDYAGRANGGAPELNQAEINWILDTALNVQNKNIIIITHQSCDPDIVGYVPNLEPLKLILAALKIKSNLNTTSAGLTLSHDFTNDTNTLICVFCGHGHNDDANTSSDGVLTIMTNCDADAVSSTAGYDRTVGTINEQCFDIVSIDPDNKKIYLTRIGAGTDREFSYT